MASPFDRPPAFFVDLDLRIADPRLADVHGHWNSLRTGAGPALVERFDPLDLARHLGDLFVVRVDWPEPPASEPVLRYTLIGTRLVEALGRDSTGLTVSDTFPPAHPVNDLYRHLIARRIPVRTHGRLDWLNRDYRRFESVLLPLVDTGGRVAKIIGAAVYDGPQVDVVATGRPA